MDILGYPADAPVQGRGPPRCPPPTLPAGAGEDAAVSQHPRLTPREVEVLRLIGRAMPDGEMALCLRISRATVATHVQHLHQKIGTNTRQG
ncbi:MAG: hypothetical protein GEU80_06885 [Dehalococcoidia bacterium]|nr:hypothetical protein [Dehalococcoidia bacterium]